MIRRILRVVQRLIHALCLPSLDRVRLKFSNDAWQQPIPPQIVEQLQRDLLTRDS
jgi:hypothetical protein